MKITLHYETQLKRAMGTATQTIEVTDGADAFEVVRTAALHHDEAIRKMLLTDDGQLRPSVLLFAGEQQVNRKNPTPVNDGDSLTVMLPISGG